MRSKTFKAIILLLLALALSLGACAPAVEAPTPSPSPSEEPSAEPSPDVLQPSDEPSAEPKEDEIYLRSAEQVYIMEIGILKNNLKFCTDGDYEFSYDFEHEDYATLIEQYGIDEIAGEGSDFERAARLMSYLAPRLTHESNFQSPVE